MGQVINAAGYKEKAPQHVQELNIKKLNECMKELKIIEEEEIKLEQTIREQN